MDRWSLLLNLEKSQSSRSKMLPEPILTQPDPTPPDIGIVRVVDPSGYSTHGHTRQEPPKPQSPNFKIRFYSQGPRFKSSVFLLASSQILCYKSKQLSLYTLIEQNDKLAQCLPSFSSALSWMHIFSGFQVLKPCWVFPYVENNAFGCLATFLFVKLFLPLQQF